MRGGKETVFEYKNKSAGKANTRWYVLSTETITLFPIFILDTKICILLQSLLCHLYACPNNLKLFQSQIWNFSKAKYASNSSKHYKDIYPFFKCPGFNNSDFFKSKDISIGLRCMINMAKTQLLFSHFLDLPSYRHRFSLSFSICCVQYVLFLLLCLHLCSALLWQPAQVSSPEEEGNDSLLWWYFRCPGSVVGFQLTVVPLAWSSTCYALVSGPFSGKKSLIRAEKFSDSHISRVMKREYFRGLEGAVQILLQL